MIGLIDQYWKKFKLMQMLKLVIMLSAFIFWSLTMPAFWFYCAHVYSWPIWLLSILLVGSWLGVVLVILVWYAIVSISAKLKKEKLLMYFGQKHKALAVLISLIK